ncbi:MAG: uracil-DNA glycosylase [Gemmatimonadaceae bacterium]
MDARERLRTYLEQRRELGESEYTLDSMTVEEALAAIDKLRPATPSRPPRIPRPQAAPAPRPVEAPPPAPHIAVSPRTDYGGETLPHPQSGTREFGEPGEASSPADASDSARQGLVVGTSNGTLFEQNPFHGIESLDALGEIIQGCTRCDLYKTAKNSVPGSGDPEADFMIVGEAPGANEDETGQPFVGQAGALLTKILAAIDLTREQVFITNVLKHRPPGNRDPAPDEVAACGPYLVRQIQMVKPKVILALGTFAAQTLLNTTTPIGKLRGAVHRYYGIPLVVTYHPAALLRNPAWKRSTWEDVKLARHVLDTSKS